MAAQGNPALSRQPLGDGGSPRQSEPPEADSARRSDATSPPGDPVRSLRRGLVSGDADAQDKAPELSVRAVAALLLYFEERYGRERLEGIWQKEQFGLSLAYLRVATNFVSLRFVEKLCDTLVRESEDPQFCRKAGFSTATPEAIGFMFHAAKAFGSPRTCYEKMIELSSTYNRVGQFIVEHIDDRQMTFAYRSGVPERNRNLCELRMGQFASFPTIWKLPSADVAELQCQVLGADRCRYVVRWHKPVLAWRRYLGLALGMALGVALGFGGLMPLGLAIPVWALLMGFGGAWLDSLHLLGVKDDFLSSQSQAMEASARDLERRYEEVYRTNVELEQRVVDRTREISEAKESLEIANQKLEAALTYQRELDRQKTQFFDNVSHELRTPLTLILLSLEAVMKNNRSGVPAWLRQYLDTMERSSARLLKLINNLLDLAKLESGKARLRYESVEMSSFLKALLLPFRVLADEKKIHLSLEGEETTPVLVDAEKIDVVFQNLLANALKFTPEGGSVTVRLFEEEPGLAIEIVDTGIGIAAQDLPMIFDRFAQADSSGIRRFGGTGIGLALVKETVELHGGRISVTSTLGAGSCFRVSLPKGTAHIREDLRERRADDIPVWRDRRAIAGDPVAVLRHKLDRETTPQMEEAGDEPATGRGGRKILIVEDDASMRRFLVNILRQRYEVCEATNGKEALLRARKMLPDLVLSDVVMPEMSGLQLTEALRREADTAETPVILLTARGEPDNAAEGLTQGANDYVPKPFSPRELLARIETQLRLRDAALAVAESERLAALGLLTSGFAHEVRNPLNGLLNALRPLQTALGTPLPAREEVAQMVQMIQQCGERISHLCESLLTFARPAREIDVVDIPRTLDATIEVLGWRTPAGVEIRKNYRSREPIFGDAGALNQVWLNLLDNALKAIGDRGVIEIGTERLKNSMLVTLVDSGCGISEDKLPLIFEPFFSTRAPGEGVGLGLALCRRVVLRHGGQIRAASKVGQGSRFEVELPLPRPVAVSPEGVEDRSGSAELAGRKWG